MPEWLIWGALIWVFFAIARGRGCGWHGSGTRHGRRLSGPDDARVDPHRSRGSRRVAPPPAVTAEQRLQRDFVDGRLTMEEYERELSKVLRKGRNEGED